MNVLIAEQSLEHGTLIASHVKNILGNDTKISGPYDNPRETVRNIWESEFHLALLDLGLGNNLDGGLYVAESLRAKSQTPVLFLADEMSEKNKIYAERVGLSNLLMKPCDRDQLEEEIKSMLFADRQLASDVFYCAGPIYQYWLRENKRKLLSIDIKNILFIESRGHYCNFNFIDGSNVMVYARLKQDIYEASLAIHSQFKLLGRSLILNIDKIGRIEDHTIVFNNTISTTLNLTTVSRKELFKNLGFI